MAIPLYAGIALGQIGRRLECRHGLCRPKVYLILLWTAAFHQIVTSFEWLFLTTNVVLGISDRKTLAFTRVPGAK